MADSLLQRYLADTGTYPESVGLSVWGTAAMRTSGDDVSEVLALLGVRPAWDEASRRVSGLDPVPLAELGRPRIDVTVRISGFFRDAFPHVVTMLDDAVRLSPGSTSRTRRITSAPTRGRTSPCTATSAGRPPGSSAPSQARTGRAAAADRRAELARRRRPGRGLRGLGRLRLRPGPGRPGGPRGHGDSYRRIAVAAHNTDTLEHDIADSDDYFQYHGGMIATVRALTGHAPARLHRRLHPPGHRPHPVARRGDRAGVPRPGGQPALGGRR